MAGEDRDLSFELPKARKPMNVKSRHGRVGFRSTACRDLNYSAKFTSAVPRPCVLDFKFNVCDVAPLTRLVIRVKTRSAFPGLPHTRPSCVACEATHDTLELAEQHGRTD